MTSRPRCSSPQDLCGGDAMGARVPVELLSNFCGSTEFSEDLSRGLDSIEPSLTVTWGSGPTVAREHLQYVL